MDGRKRTKFKSLSIESLASARVALDPWTWGAYNGVFQEQVLNAPFPSDHFSYHAQRRLLEAMGKKGGDAWCQHNVRTRPLLELGETKPFKPESLHTAWLDLARELNVPEFRDCLSDVVEHDVRALQLQAHFWEFHPGSFFQPHIDKPHKKITFLMYLTKNWGEENGGCLQVLGSSDLSDVHHTVPPTANNGVILKRDPDSWHAVTRIPFDSKQPRRLVQAWFWEDV